MATQSRSIYLNNQNAEVVKVFLPQQNTPLDEIPRRYSNGRCSIFRHMYTKQTSLFHVAGILTILALVVLIITVLAQTMVIHPSKVKSNTNIDCVNQHPCPRNKFLSPKNSNKRNDNTDSSEIKPLSEPKDKNFTTETEDDLEIFKVNPDHSEEIDGTDPKSYVKIRSVEDLKKLQLEVNTHLETIIVEKLTEESPTVYEIQNASNIKHVKFAGPITEAWMEKILYTFNETEMITVDINELCVGSVVRDRKLLPQIVLESVKLVRIKNAQFCSIATWLLSWDLPNIENLELSKADLTKRIFEPIHGFLERHKNSLSTLTISRSFVCSSCSFSEEERKSTRIQILDSDDKHLTPKI